MRWNDLLSLKPMQIDDLRSLGYAYLRQGDFQLSRLVFEALVDLDRTSYDYQALGIIDLRENHADSAVRYFDRALELEPDNDYVRLQRTKANLMLGHKKQAIQQAQALLNSEKEGIASAAAALLLTLL